MVKHIAIYISNNDDKRQLFECIISGNINAHYVNLKPAIFSELTLNAFIEEEMRHGHFDVNTDTKNSLEKSSEGERKKALLNHLIGTNPDYLIADNIFGNLDIKSQEAIEKTLRQLSKKTSIVQITNRRNEILNFIDETYQLKENKLVPFQDRKVETNKKSASLKLLTDILETDAGGSTYKKIWIIN